jgi:hypothetical protein
MIPLDHDPLVAELVDLTLIPTQPGQLRAIGRVRIYDEIAIPAASDLRIEFTLFNLSTNQPTAPAYARISTPESQFALDVACALPTPPPGRYQLRATIHHTSQALSTTLGPTLKVE